MQPLLPAAVLPVLQTLTRRGFAFVPGEQARSLLSTHGPLADWAQFAASWDALEPDMYLALQGRHRRRRHAVYRLFRSGGMTRQPHQPHFQSREYNPLQGGIERWFSPITPDIGDSACLRTILRFARDSFGRLLPSTSTWHVEVHQFRIEARKGEAGQPTPEGRHRDGVDYVLVLMIQRRNILSGTTRIHTPEGALLGEFTLTHPLDMALVDDAQVHHGVTAVEPIDPSLPAQRDVLVVTFRGMA